MIRFILALVLVTFASLCTAAEGQRPNSAPDKGTDTAKTATKTKKPAQKNTKSAPQKKAKTAPATHK
jgi:hypothetical protein